MFFGDNADAPGTRHADPYFGGACPERTSCVGCGGCMVGCRHVWPFSKQLATSGAKIPAYIPAANDFARKAARALGGATMAHDARDGVCDGRSRVFGYRNMYVCDGSVLGANLGVNPSLTITALAEHATSHVPAAGEQQWDSAGEERAAA
ncbi:cholesterol oxidase [Burkholderia thailandensis MSMB121]|nr:GMC oxidoreductase [Burkholderia humptydooensis]AGK50509.1 cholesterol oxidase [Burkholderia thailandensis MSMB121]ATF33678.1 FeS-binding protein [Burkholderia thailandensis]KST71758.1 FeS-binding protein [Burkholderia humptydooensis]